MSCGMSCSRTILRSGWQFHSYENYLSLKQSLFKVLYILSRFDEFGWNWMSVYVLYDAFVNDVVCDRDYPCYRILTLLVIEIIYEDD